MNEQWIANIRKHHEAATAILNDLEGKYVLLENETEIYNEEMQTAVEHLASAITALDEAARDATRHAGSKPDSSNR